MAVVGLVVVLVEELIPGNSEQAERFESMGFLHVADSSFAGQGSVGA